MAHLSLGVLGSLQILLDDTPVTALESDKVCALLAYLAVEADRPHRRESLVGLLWPDCPEQTARHNLRQALFNLRLALGDHNASPPYLLISRSAIQFNRASDHSLDLAQFNKIYTTCEEDRDRCIEDCSLRAARLEEMVKLYRGEFLDQFFLEDSAAFEEWTLVQRESSHQILLEAYSYLASYYDLHGDFQAMRHHALRQLELDPWREEAHYQMMRALALDGQRSAALTQYETCRRVLAEELGVEPSVKTSELVEQIRTGTLKAKEEAPHAIATNRSHNLPVSLGPFLGREQELRDLARLIANPECRCINLVGPGGIGKTRLALQTAGQHRAGFAHGVVFVPLASVGSAEAVIPAMASALGFSFFGASEPRAQLLNYLGQKQMLLILDNVEHLLPEGPLQANLVGLMLEILQHASGIKLLVTSREALNLQEEWLFEVRGLAFPATEQMEGSGEFAAVALFIQRARRAAPGFDFDEADLAAIAHLCRLVEGMPLAIELAATWLRTLSPAEIAKEIEGNLDFLSAPLRDLPERHRSMRVVFDHSWRMLSEKEQQVLSRLSVFRGGFSRKAAEQVAGASLPVLSTLVNRTLVRRAAAGRYQLHMLVRQYSATRLVACGQADAAQKRHYDYFLALAEAAEQQLNGREQVEWLGRLEQEQDNLRAALAWALDHDLATPGGDDLALRLAAALRRYWAMRGHFHEGRSWLVKSLQPCPDRRTATRAAGLLGKSLLTYALGDLDTARLAAEESAPICRELGDQLALTEALTAIGVTLAWQGEARLAEARLEEVLAICGEVGNQSGVTRALNWLGSYLTAYSGDLTGQAMFEGSAAILEELGEQFVLSGVLIALGIVAREFGDYSAARARLEFGLTMAREIAAPLGMADALTNLGSVHHILGEYPVAQSHLAEALQVYQAFGRGLRETNALCALAENALSQGDLVTARVHIQAAANCLGTSEDKWLRTRVCYFRGLLAHAEGDDVAAMRLLRETVGLAREAQFRPVLARSVVALGRVHRTLREFSPASDLLLEGLNLFRKLGHRLGIAITLEELGAVSAVQEDGIQAAMLFSTAHALREELGAPLPPVDRVDYESVVADCRAQLGEIAFAEAWAHATTRPWEELVEEVLKEHPYPLGGST